MERMLLLSRDRGYASVLVFFYCDKVIVQKGTGVGKCLFDLHSHISVHYTGRCGPEAHGRREEQRTAPES